MTGLRPGASVGPSAVSGQQLLQQQVARQQPPAAGQHPAEQLASPEAGGPAKATRSSRLGLFKRSSTLGGGGAAANATSSSSGGSLQDLNPAGSNASSSASRKQESDFLRAGRKLANQQQQQQQHQLAPGQHRNHQLLLTAQNQHLLQPDLAGPSPHPAHFPNMQLDYLGGLAHEPMALGANQAQLQHHQNQQHQAHHLQQQQQQQQHNTIHYKSHTTDSGSLALNDQTTTTGSEQCNDQEHEERPSCIQIMKRLFFSLVLGTIIAICWVIIIHTLKWIAIKGNEFELINQQQLQHLHHRSSAALQGNGLAGEDASGGVSNNFDPAAASFRLNHAATLLVQGQPPATMEGERGGDFSVASVAAGAQPSEPPTYLEARNASRLLVEQVEPKDAPLSRVEKLDTRKGGNATSAGDGHNFIRAKSGRLRRLASDGLDDDTDDSSAGSGSGTLSELDSREVADQHKPTSLALADIRHNLRKQQREQSDQSSSLVSNGQHSSKQQLYQKRKPVHLSSIVPQNQHNSAPLASHPIPGAQNNHASDPSVRQVSSSSHLPATPPLVIQDYGSSGGYNEDSLKSEASSSSMVSSESAQEPPSITGQWPSAPAIDAATSSLDSRGPHVAGLVYRAPFFTSWFVSIWNILFMPVFTLISSCCFRNEDSTTKKLLVESISQFMDNGLTTLQFLGRCAFFSVLWIGTIFGIVYSLSNIDATVVMALFACSAALVYLLSWVLLHQQFVGVRIVAVIICTTGIALLAYMDNSRTLGSVLIVAGSALCSAIYKVIYQRMFGFWSIAQMSLFFTLIGLFNAFLMWPVALLLYFLGIELIAWRYIPWMHLTAAGALHLTANIVAYFGPICSYDIFLTMGLLLAVILSAVIDVTFYKITFFGMKLAGVLLLMIGFLVCLLPENWNEFLYDLVNERFVRWKKRRNLKKSRNKVQDLSTGQMSRLRTPSGRVK